MYSEKKDLKKVNFTLVFYLTKGGSTFVEHMGHIVILSAHTKGAFDAGRLQKRGSCPQTGPDILPSGPGSYRVHL